MSDMCMYSHLLHNVETLVGQKRKKIGTPVTAVCRTFSSFAINTFAGIGHYRFGKTSNKCVGNFGFSPTLMSNYGKLNHVHKWNFLRISLRISYILLKFYIRNLRHFFWHDIDIQVYFFITRLLLPEHLQINYCTYHTSYPIYCLSLKLEEKIFD
jgi:hypothetical protein